MTRLFRPLVFVVLLLACVSNASIAAAEKYRLVAGTENIADIVRDLLPDKVEILTLIPASSCPGHHDIRASDMAFFTQAEMVVLHMWQRDYPGIPEAVQAAKLPGEAVLFVENRGSFLVPENQIVASKEIADFLLGLRGVDKDALKARLQDRIRRITDLATESRLALAFCKGTPTLSAAMQTEFVRWLGLDVVDEYGRAEDLSPGGMIQLVDSGRKAGVLLVVDNLQSGSEAGAPLARELKAAHVGFSNFPGFSPEAPTYESLLKLNVRLLQEALTARMQNAS
ncbi:metal ABC transporter substrate-binding protein [Desulfovibrio sp. OttesenSCG-928-M14]|nr:metal ABC transporter substrate-binding protein [Desulfovibrio sp. OttesenSCG-928-M14]